MAVPFLLIDGYNLLHAAGFARHTYGDGMLEQCRLRLIRYLLNHLTQAERKRATLVFDAGEAPTDLPRQWVIQGLQVVFAKPGGDADSEIERLIVRHSAPRLLRIISSDHRLQKAARKRRCRFADSEDFVEELEKRGPISHPSENDNGSTKVSNPKYSGHLFPEDVRYWMQVFANRIEIDEMDETTSTGESAPSDDAEQQQQQQVPSDSHRDEIEDEEPFGIETSELEFWQKRVDELHDELDDDEQAP